MDGSFMKAIEEFAFFHKVIKLIEFESLSILCEHECAPRKAQEG